MCVNKSKIRKTVVIECNVICTKCQKNVSAIYVNSETISMIKKSTENWRVIKGFGTLCPQCYAFITDDIRCP